MPIVTLARPRAKLQVEKVYDQSRPTGGNKQQALNALEKGYQRREHYLIMWIAVSPEFDALRSEPRFQKILQDLDVSQ